MAKSKTDKGPKQEPPMQFRPGLELKQLIALLATSHELSLPEACKNLIALALCGMDSRYYPLVAQMAAATGGAGCFVPSCFHVRHALLGAERVGGRLDETARASFIARTAADYLATFGRELDRSALWFEFELPEPSPSPAAGRGDDHLEKMGRRPVRRLKSGPGAASQSSEGVPSGPTEAAAGGEAAERVDEALAAEREEEPPEFERAPDAPARRDAGRRGRTREAEAGRGGG